jgi:acid phosphatase type 7
MTTAPGGRRSWLGSIASMATLLVTIAALSVCSDRSPVSPTPSPQPSPSPSPSPGAQGGGDAVFVGAGDIGLCGTTGAESTAQLLDGIPGTVFTLGDHAYYSGTDREFRECFDPSWGRHRGRIHPVPGNHDYETPGAAPYFGYFGAAAGPPGLGYYAYRLGRWEIFALNSNIPIGEGSAQLAWLRAELALRPSRCSLAYWHHPIITEGPNGPNPHVRALWQLLNEYHVEIALTGHDHQYQRFPPLDGELRRAPFNGLRLFVVGTGGAMLYPFPAPPSLTEARAPVWGVLRLTLQEAGYDWEFISAAGATFRDAGRDTCH